MIVVLFVFMKHVISFFRDVMMVEKENAISVCQICFGVGHVCDDLNHVVPSGLRGIDCFAGRIIEPFHSSCHEDGKDDHFFHSFHCFIWVILSQAFLNKFISFFKKLNYVRLSFKALIEVNFIKSSNFYAIQEPGSKLCTKLFKIFASRVWVTLLDVLFSKLFKISETICVSLFHKCNHILNHLHITISLCCLHIVDHSLGILSNRVNVCRT